MARRVKTLPQGDHVQALAQQNTILLHELASDEHEWLGRSGRHTRHDQGHEIEVTSLRGDRYSGGATRVGNGADGYCSNN